MALQVLTANRLSDGVVVYFTAAGRWSERIAEARTADKADAKALVGDAERTAGEVVEPYLIDVEATAETGAETGAETAAETTVETGAPRPLRFRERIRAFGPPVHPQFAKIETPRAEG